jgi:hypothetical protein
MKGMRVEIVAAWMAGTLIFSAAALTEASQPEKAPAGKSSVILTVMNPQGRIEKRRELAPRLETLKGKRVALWLSATRDQVYAGRGAELYDILEKMLKERFAGIQIVSYTTLPMKFAPEKEVIAAIEKTRPDALIAGFGG